MSNETTGNGKFIEIWSNEFNRVFEYIFEHSLIGMVIVNSDGNFIRLNQKACEILEYQEAELVGKHWKEITHPDYIEPSDHYMSGYYKDKSSSFHAIIEKKYITGHGKTKECRTHVTALRDEKGNILYFITQIQDITQKKEVLCSIQKGLDFIKEMRCK